MRCIKPFSALVLLIGGCHERNPADTLDYRAGLAVWFVLVVVLTLPTGRGPKGWLLHVLSSMSFPPCPLPVGVLSKMPLLQPILDWL